MRRLPGAAWLLVAAAACGAGAATGAPDDAAALRSLAARWWQWRVSLPELAAPSKDPAGRYCDIGQEGSDVFFLAGFLSAGAESGEIRRRCVVPAGKRLFFPVATFVFFPPSGGEASLCARETASAAAQADTETDLNVVLDGNRLPAEAIRRVGTRECFTLPTGRPAPSGYPAASDGYWVLLPPLPAGPHRLEYGARYKAGNMARDQFQRTSYELEVR